METYTPVGCYLDDTLEDAIVRGRRIPLTYSVSGEETEIEATPIRIDTINREEFLVFAENDLRIRLDHITRFNGDSSWFAC